MKNAVQILINFGLVNDWKDLIVNDLLITDFSDAIDLVRKSKIHNVQLRQKSLGSTMEWDNF
jgi:hypothetical protein